MTKSSAGPSFCGKENTRQEGSPSLGTFPGTACTRWLPALGRTGTQGPHCGAGPGHILPVCPGRGQAEPHRSQRSGGPVKAGLRHPEGHSAPWKQPCVTRKELGPKNSVTLHLKAQACRHLRPTRGGAGRWGAQVILSGTHRLEGQP